MIKNITNSFAKNILRIALEKNFPLSRERISILSNHKLYFIKFNIAVSIDKDFACSLTKIVRTAAQAVSEEYSLDAMEFSLEII